MRRALIICVGFYLSFSSPGPTSFPLVGWARPILPPAPQSALDLPLHGIGSMVRIAAGPFVMGARDDREDNGPPHTVDLDAFWLDRYEVTVGEYQEFLRRFSQADYQPRQPYGSMPPQYFTSPHYQRYPMVNVSWFAAQAYCAWKGKRLPTEAEWEKAARGTDGRIWPWGHAFGPERANVAGLRDGYGYTAPVGTYPAGRSPYGVDDLAGNVWEWVADRYDAQYYARSPQRNPTGPSEGTLRVVRGGCWFTDERFARATYRNHAYPEARDNSLGFRCARSPGAARQEYGDRQRPIQRHRVQGCEEDGLYWRR